MNTRDKLAQLRRSEAANQEHERRFREERKTMPEHNKPWHVDFTPDPEPEKSRYTLTRAEREVVIRFDAEERIAHVYTNDPVYIRRLDVLCVEDPDTWKCVQVDDLGYFKKYEAPADRIAFRKAPTEARREAGRQHMQRMQQKP